MEEEKRIALKRLLCDLTRLESALTMKKSTGDSKYVKLLEVAIENKKAEIEITKKLNFLKPKKIKVRLKTPRGERILEYKRVGFLHPKEVFDEELGETIIDSDENFCVNQCPYGGKDPTICDRLKDPRGSKFSPCYMGFCQKIGHDDIIGLGEYDVVDMNFYVPVIGTLAEFVREM